MPFERYFAIPHMRSKQHHARLFDDLDNAREYLRKHGGGTIRERNAKVICSSRLGLSKVVFDPPLRTWGDVEVIGVEGESKEERKKPQFEIVSNAARHFLSRHLSVYPSDSKTLDHKAFGYWVTGFTDGEGSFYYAAAQRQVRFRLRLNKDDLTALKLVRAYWEGIGRIYEEPPKDRSDASKSHKTRAAEGFEVYRPKELLVVVKHFEEFPLLSKKAMSFEVWKQMVHVKVNEKDYSNAGALLNALNVLLRSLQGPSKTKKGYSKKEYSSTEELLDALGVLLSRSQGYSGRGG